MEPSINAAHNSDLM